MSTPTRPADVVQPLEDPLIDEIRAIRRKQSEAAGNDPVRLAEHARRATEEYLRRSGPTTPSPERRAED